MATAADVAVRNMQTSGITPENQMGRPPFVRFETRSVEDRNATIKAGHWVGVDVAYALITPRGSKDVHEEIATEWLVKMEQEVREDRFPQQWLNMFKDAFQRWTAGQDAPLDGTSLKEWPPIRPAQLRMMAAVGVLTVEDLAAANEETVMALGMGGRALRESAKNWLLASRDTGATVAKMRALEEENAALKTRQETLDGQVRGLTARLDAAETRSNEKFIATPNRTTSIVDEAFLEDLPPTPKAKRI